ncbi:MAG: isopentenyl-diphosphate delta-isomerase [Candidatus Thermoplasmatota archaeon]|nr:isopentenyl-diphosphate delta-isomerase [Candidatus Thermoplasmatota archaeon]
MDHIQSDVSQELLHAGYDSDQVDMMSEQVILVDHSDNILGPMSKVDAHRGDGVLHRAFSILIFDDEDRLLVQKRASHKITFPNVWANTVCSHPLHIEGEMDSDTIGHGSKNAAIRKMNQELGIPIDTFSTENIHFITRMMYRARADDVWVEHELDHILFARAPNDMVVDPNPNEISETKWVSQNELDGWLNSDVSDLGIIAPWFRLIAENIMCDWWGNLDGLPSLADEKIRDYGDVSMMDDTRIDSSKLGVMSALSSHKDEVESRVIRALSKTGNARLGSAMKHLIDGGGKRLRAILPWLVADAVGTSNDGLYDLGASIEIIHNFTLVHDDIMDNDSVRRGRPAVHVAYDNPTAINAGDAMLAVAFEVLAESDQFDDEHFRDLVRIIGSMVRRVSEGQQQDMSFEERYDVDEDEYLHMISGKTAAMFTTCSRTGALLSGASPETVEIMAEWGENVGLCFQLMDDLIDATGDSETLGKPACSDIIEGKQTLIAIHALKQDPAHLRNFHEVFGSGIDETDRDVLDSVVRELQQSKSIPYAYEKAMAYHAAAHQCLSKLPDSDSMQVLRDLTDFQVIRIS